MIKIDHQAGYRHISLRTEGNFPMSLPMLFICIELKIYVPDGLGDLMDALSDPRAFLSNQEKRLRQMKAMGVEEMDLLGGGSPAPGGIEFETSAAGSLLAAGAIATASAAAGADLELWRAEEISVEVLQQQKKFLKLRKQQLKKLKQLQKVHEKERTEVQKQQCQQVEKKLTASKQPNEVGWNGVGCGSTTGSGSVGTMGSCSSGSTARESSISGSSLSTGGCSSLLDPTRPSSQSNSTMDSTIIDSNTDRLYENVQLKEVIRHQIRQWSQMLERQKKSELELLKQQLIEQGELSLIN